jgi:hypothetical protein
LELMQNSKRLIYHWCHLNVCSHELT